MSRAARGWIPIGLLALAGCASTPPTTAGTASPPPSVPVASSLEGPPAAGSHGGAVSVPGLLLGNLGFRDQVSDGQSVVGSAEIDGSGGWVVVRQDRAGVPGRVLGSEYRANEAHDDVVTVRLKAPTSSGPLWVSLHVDAGVLRRLEFPGPDKPIQFAGADLADRLILTVRTGP